MFKTSFACKELLCTACLVACISAQAISQSHENGGWLFLSHTQKLFRKFDLLADAQVRSSDKFLHVSTLLLRGAFSYNFNERHSAAIGYAYKGDWMQESLKTFYEPENRVYEQYLFSGKQKRKEINLRFRLEQRFVKEEATQFSQRARAFVNGQFPLAANPDFSRGLYTTLQYEFFANVQNKENVNNYFFDQGRSFISLGYRWSKNIDTEAGYLLQIKKEETGTSYHHIVQLMITTKL